MRHKCLCALALWIVASLAVGRVLAQDAPATADPIQAETLSEAVSAEQAPPAAASQPEAPPATSQPASVSPAPPPAAPEIHFSFKGASFQQVIDFFSRTTGLPVIWESPAPEGTLDYISPRGYDQAEALRVLNIILQSKGVMLRVSENMLYLQKLDDMKREDVPTFVGKLPAEVPSDAIVTIVRQLEIALAKPVAEKLANMVASYGSITAMEQQNALVITETAANTRRLLTIIDQLDLQDPDGAVEIFAIKHAKATELMTPLKALLSQKVEKFVINQEGRQVKIEEDQMPGLTISSDDRTNSIIAKGTQNKIDKLREAIGLLDVPATEGSQGRMMATFGLSTISAAEAAAKLNQLFSKIEEKARPTVLSMDDSAKVMVIGSDDAVAEGTRLLRELDGGLAAPNQAEPMMAVIALEQGTPQNVITAITSLLNKRQQSLTKLLAGPDGRSVIVSGMPADVESVKAMVPVLDRQSAADRQVRLARITQGDAAAILAQAKTLFETQKQADPANPIWSINAELDVETRLVTIIGPQRGLELFTGLLKQIESNVIIDREVRRFELANVLPGELVAPLTSLAQQMLQPEDGSQFVPPVFSALDQLNTLVVTATPPQMAALESLISSLDVPKSGAGETMPLRLLQLRIADAANLANVITQQYSQRPPAERKARPVTVAADPNTNALLLSVHPDLLPEVQAMVDELNKIERPDEDAEPRELRVLPLKVARAEELATTVDQMFPPPPVPLDVRGRPQPQLQKPKELLVRPDRQTNTLILSGRPSAVELAEQVVKQLDADPSTLTTGGDLRSVRVITLINAEAQQLAANLEALFATPDQLEQKPLIRSDPVSNSLLVRATAEQFTTIEAVVAKVDQATIASTRQLRMIPVDRSKTSAQELAATLQRMLNQTSGSGVEVISLDELLKRQQESKQPDPKASSSLNVSPAPISRWSMIAACAIALPQSDPAPLVPDADVTIAVDPVTNSLILLGSQRGIERVSALINQIQSQLPAAPSTIRYLPLPPHLDAQQMSTVINAALDRFTPPGGQVGDLKRRAALIVDSTANALVIAASDADFEPIADLIAALSRPAGEAEFPVRTITLTKAEAAAVAGAVQQFYDDRAKVAAATGRAPKQQQRRISIMGIESSNTLLISAADEDFAQIQELVKQFDTAEASAGLTFRVFQLKHAKAAEIERNVQSLVDDLTWNQADRIFYWPPQNRSTKKDTIAVRADPRLNVLMVTGRGDKFDVVEQMIDILDAPPPDGEQKLVRLYRLKQAPPQTVADLVREVFNQGRQRRPWEAPDPSEIKVRVDDSAGVVIVSATANEQDEIKAMIEGLDQQLASGSPAQQTQVLPVQFARATEIATTLSRFLTDRAKGAGLPRPTATVVASDSANTLIVSAAEDELATIRDLLGRLDQADLTGERAMEIVALREGDAQEIARIVKEQFGRRVASGNAPSGVIVTPDARTNSIIINAPQEEFAQAKALIERLDAPADADETIIRTYALKGARAEEAVRVLTQTLRLDAGGRTSGITIKLEEQQGEAVEVKARIVADKRSNSLIVTATQQSFPVVEAILKKVDEVPAVSPIEYRIVTLKHAMAAEVSQTLQQITRNLDDGQPQPRVDFNRLENRLIIGASADQFRQIDKILAHVDVPSNQDRVTDFVPLKFAEAEKIQEALSMFYGPLAQEADSPEKKNVRIVADPATNSLVISAAQGQWEGIRALLDRLDAQEYDSSLQLKVLPLVYADANSVARAINDAFQTTVQQNRSARGGGGGGNQQGRQPQFNPNMGGFFETMTMLVQADEWVRASAEPQTNTVIVSASRQNIEKVEQIIKQLDVADYAKLPQPQLIPLSGGADPIALAASITQLYAQSRTGAGSGAGYPPLSVVGNTSGNCLIVRAEADDFKQIKALAEALQQQASTQGLMVNVVKLNAAPAARVASAITEAFQAKARQSNQPLTIKVDAPGNSLVIASNAALLEEIKATVASLDAMAPAAGQSVFIIDLQNISPETARSVIQTIGLDKPQPADSTSRLVSEPIKVSLMEGRNAIIVLGNPADRDTIVGLLKAIDSEVPLAEAQTRVVSLKHAQAAALSQILAQVLKPADQQADTPLARAVREQVRRLSVQSNQSGGGRFQLDLSKPVRLIADPSLNALVISSTYENVEAMEQLIAMFDRLPITDAVTVQIFPLQNIAAEQFSRIAKDLFAQGKQLGRTAITKVVGVPEGAVGKALLDEVAITTDDRTNTVIVAGSEDAVALVEVLTKRLDNEVTAAWVEPKVLPLRFADAADLAQTLQAIIVDGVGNLPQSSPLQRQIGRLRLARLAPNGATQPGVIESDVFVPMTRLVIRAEPQMNALILVGTPDNLEVVSELVAMLDVESASPSDSVRIYPVANASASRLAQTIKQLFDQQVQTKAIRPEDRVIIQADERTNALVVATSSRSFAVLETMLKTLDNKLAPELREIRTIDVKNASAPRLATLIQQMMDARLERLRKVQPETADLERATIAADPRTNSLIIAAGNDSWDVIQRLAADLDTSTLGEASLISVLPLTKGNPERLAQTINQIMARRYADLPAELRNSQRPLVMTDNRTNSLLVAANPEDLASIEDLVRKLADAPENSAVGVHLITLGPGVRAELIAPRVQRLMAERQQSLGASGTPTDRVTIEPDLASNSLIVAATDENLAVVKGLIDVIAQAGGDSGREVEVVSLRASRAADMIDLLTDLYVKEANRTRGQDTVRVTADERLNAVVINAPGEDVRSIKELVAQLDGAKPAAVVEIKYVPLQSANAVETVSLIENVLSGRGLGGRRNPRQATVLKYLREIVKAEDGSTPEPPEAGDDADLEVEVSAAIRESITLTPDLRTNTVIVSAPKESIGMIERMIRDLDDSSTGSKNIRIFKLVNADAIAMAEILTDLFRLKQGNSMYVLKPREDASSTIGFGSAPASDASMAANPSGVVSAADLGGMGGTELTAVPDERQQLSITVDSRTNSLIVSGTPTYLDLVSKVVEELDALEANERETFVYQLRNAVAADVAKVLGEFVAQEQQKMISTLSADQLGSAARLLEREITIRGDDKSNTVLVSASPRYIDRVKEMIRQLDVDPPQVLIQVMLAEVTLDTREDYGVDLRVGGEVGGADWSAGYGLASAFVTGLGVPNIAITSTDFDLLIRALKSQGRLQVLSNPSIMAANNAPARIQVGETIRIPTTTSVSDAGRTSSTLEKEDLGVILKVTPSINPDGFVRMNITPEISNLSARTTQISEDFQSPIITRRTADTTVTVHDGQTIVIGGLISDRFERRDRKVPFLGDLPVLGMLFRSETEESAKTELLIVLTPHVIDSPAQFSRVGEITQGEIDRLTLPDEVKDQIRKSLIDGTGGLYDANGNRIEIKQDDEEQD